MSGIKTFTTDALLLFLELSLPGGRLPILRGGQNCISPQRHGRDQDDFENTTRFSHGASASPVDVQMGFRTAFECSFGEVIPWLGDLG